MTREQLEIACDKLKEIEDGVHSALVSFNRDDNEWHLDEVLNELIPELAQYLEEVCTKD